MDPIAFPTSKTTSAAAGSAQAGRGGKAAGGFARILEGTLEQVDQLQNSADRARVELATGASGDIHQTMIAVEKASVAFELMLQVRNKLISAYETVMRMQV